MSRVHLWATCALRVCLHNFESSASVFGTIELTDPNCYDQQLLYARSDSCGVL